MNKSQKEIFDESRPKGVMPPTGMTCSAGQVIFEQGTPANQAFFIESGTVEVLIERDGHCIKLAEIGPGEVFGEMGVLEREARSASVRAVDKCRIYVMTREEMEKRLERVEDPVVAALINSFAKRLRATSIGNIKYYKNLAEFQNRVAGLMDLADQGIDADRRTAFAAEITPLLDEVEAMLHKYRKPDS